MSINTLVNELIDTSFTSNSVQFEPLANDAYVNIDPIRVKLLLKNLLKNAIQYTPKDKDKPIVSLCLTTQELIVCVEDFGVGVAEDQLSRLTEPFYRPDPSRQRDTGGYGLRPLLMPCYRQSPQRQSRYFQ